MRWQSNLAWMIATLLAVPAWAAPSDPVPIVQSEPGSLGREVQQVSTVTQLEVDGESTSRKSGPETVSGVIKLIKPPRMAARPAARIQDSQTPPSPPESAAIGGGTRPLPAASAPAAKPVKALNSPLVVRRTARLSVEIETQSMSETQHRVDIIVRNESPQTAGRTRLVVTVPEELAVIRSRPTPDDRQQFSDAQRFVYDLDGLAASDQGTVSLTVEGTEDVRGLIRAVIETQAEASKLVAHDSGSDEGAVVRQTTQPDPMPVADLQPEVVQAPRERSSLRRGEKLELPLQVNGPQRAQLKATIVYSLSLENLSDIDLDEIMIKAKLPEGVYLEGRTDLQLTNSLPAGMQRSMDVAVRAQRDGEFTVTFEAWHAGAKIGEQSVALEVVASDLKAGLGGPQSWNVGDEATFVIDLECKGTESIKDIVVTLQLPDNVQVTTVEHEAGYDAERRLMAWRIVSLEPGASVKLHYKALGLKSGEAVQGLLVKTPDLNAPLRTSLSSEVRGHGTLGIKLNQNFLRR